MPDLAVCRVDKLKSKAHVIAALHHNQRVQGYDPKHVDSKGQCWELLDASGRERWVNVRKTQLDAEAYAARIYDGRSLKKGAIAAAEMVLSASPEYFRPLAPSAAGTYDRDRLVAWSKAAIKFLKAEVGSENLISVTLQCDEATPHIQAIFRPKTTWSDQYGSDRGKQNGKQKLSALQDRYGEAMSELGIERGVKRTKARKHQDVKIYYSAVNAALDAIEQPEEVRAPTDGTPLTPAIVDDLLERQRQASQAAYKPGTDKFLEVMALDRQAKRVLDENVGLRVELEQLRSTVHHQDAVIGELHHAVDERDRQLTIWQEFADGFITAAQNALRRIGLAQKLQPFTDALDDLMRTLLRTTQRKMDGHEQTADLEVGR